MTDVEIIEQAIRIRRCGAMIALISLETVRPTDPDTAEVDFTKRPHVVRRFKSPQPGDGHDFARAYGINCENQN